MLKVVGIGPESENAFEVLVARGEGTPEEIAAETGLPVPRVRLVLRKLEDRGLARQIDSSPVRYAAVDPGIALDVLLLQREEEVKRARARAIELSERFHQAAAGRNPTKLVETVTGRRAVAERIEQICGSARHEIRGFDTPPYIGTASAANESERALLERHGQVRVIYAKAAVEQPGRLADLERGVTWGEQARVLPALPMKLVLVDDRIGAVPLQASPGAIASVALVHPSGLLEGLSALFEALWQVALPLDLDAERGANPPDQPSRDERRILSLLTAGLPDEMVARQLGMSDRTYQRRIHDLMKRLRAQTRFQLARQAMQNGWLDTDGRGRKRSVRPEDRDDVVRSRPARFVPGASTGGSGRVDAAVSLPVLANGRRR